MTSYEFEVAAKNAVIKASEEQFGGFYQIEDIEIVMFSRIGDRFRAFIVNRMIPDNTIFDAVRIEQEERIYVNTWIRTRYKSTEVNTIVDTAKGGKE